MVQCYSVGNGQKGDWFVVRLTCRVFAVQFLCKAVPATFSLLFVILIIIPKASAHKHANTRKNRRKRDTSRVFFFLWSETARVRRKT